MLDLSRGTEPLETDLGTIFKRAQNGVKNCLAKIDIASALPPLLAKF